MAYTQKQKDEIIGNCPKCDKSDLIIIDKQNNMGQCENCNEIFEYHVFDRVKAHNDHINLMNWLHSKVFN